METISRCRQVMSMVTIKDVAKEAGVGVGTASRALTGNGSVRADTKAKVDAAAEKLGFVPNQLARNFKMRSTMCVAIIIPTVFHPFFAKVVNCCEVELYKLGYRLIVVNSQDDVEKETQMLNMIRQQRVDGIIFITHYEHDDIDPNLPIVSIDRHVGSGFPYVTSNNYAASYQAIKSLIDSGAQKIGCVCGATAVISETRHRYEAYFDIMHEYSRPDRLLKPLFKHGQEMEVMREYFAQYPETDALFTGSDMLASAGYHVARERGMRVPEDLQIIGYDGILDAWEAHPKLTTVRQNIPEMAKAVVDLLMKRIRGEEAPPRVEIPATLVKGETTR